MSGGLRGQDLFLVLSGLQRVALSAGHLRQSQIQQFWKYSSLKKFQLPQPPASTTKRLTPEALLAQSGLLVVDNTVVFSQAFAKATVKQWMGQEGASEASLNASGEKYNFVEVAEEPMTKAVEEVEIVSMLNRDVSALDIIDRVSDLTDAEQIEQTAFVKTAVVKTKGTPRVEKKSVPRAPEDSQAMENETKKNHFRPAQGTSPVSTGPPKTKLLNSAKERAVPSTRIGRLATFGSLGFGLGLGVMAEASKRALGIRPERKSDALLDGSLILTEANAERIVNTLCRVRGAALKLGQMLSIQDESLISPELSQIFERVRESADFMPLRQLEKVMIAEFGSDWRQKHFQEFSDQPFAAASIGQVHTAKTLSGQNVAVKIQYPGVAKGIESDINNLLGVLKVANILPERLFIDSVVEHMKIELAQECDYEREAACCRRMRSLLEPFPEFYVPRVIDDLSTKQVFTTELITGLTIDQCAEIEDQDTRDYITLIILELLLRELFIFRYMQTDPNWANFLFNPDTKQLGLLDFGATREYSPFFVNNYCKIIDGAARGDRQQILEYSRIVGFLTGYESQLMNDAHVDSVMILGEAFRTNEKFNFGQQRTTARMQEKVSVMLQHRLCAPPKEVYSLHRKMSGLFLLSTKLRSNVNCYHVWRKLAEEFRPHPEV